MNIYEDDDDDINVFIEERTPEEIRRDELRSRRVTQTPISFEEANRHIYTNQPVVIEDYATRLLNRARSGVRDSIPLLYSAKPSLCADKQFVLDEVRRSGKNLEFASKELRDDKQVVMESVASMGNSIKWASERLVADKDVVILAATNQPESLHFAPTHFKDDMEIMYEATRNNGWALNYASDRLKDDKDFVLRAITAQPGNSMCFMHASERLREDMSLLLTAVKISPEVVAHAGPNLKEEIGNEEPAIYLERALFAQRLNRTIPQKPATKEPARRKI